MNDDENIDHNIDSNAEINRESLKGYLGKDANEADVIGFLSYYMTGDVLVPREWLIEKFQEYGLDENMLPRKVTPLSGYKRAMQYLLNSRNQSERKFINDSENPWKIEYELKDIESQNHMKRLIALVYIPEKEIDIQGGKILKHDLGRFWWDYDNDRMGHKSEVDQESQRELHQMWLKFVGRAQGLSKKMQVTHTGQDLRIIFWSLTKKDSTAIPMRDAGVVYFFPSRFAKTLEGLSKVWEGINQFKVSGKHNLSALVTVPVIDEDHLVEQVQRMAELELDNRVDDIFESWMEQVEEDETNVEEMAQDIVSELIPISEMTNEYSKLLKTEMTLKPKIEEWLKETTGSETKEKVVADVLNKMKHE